MPIFACTKEANICPANQYLVDCKSCDENIPQGFGCNCVADKAVLNCQTCVGGLCSKCIQKFVLKDEQCEICGSNCLECSAPETCITCNEHFVPINGICTQICQEGCSKCKNENICNECDSDRQLNIYGVCEKDCSGKAVVDGNYCKNGSVLPCGEGITSECQCGTPDNCASCKVSADGSELCDTCLPGFQKEGDACVQCAEGYQKYMTLCLSIKMAEGKCNSAYNICKVDTFCPAINIDEIDCKSCEETIVPGQGCNCIVDTASVNCQTCESGSCSKCISGFFLDADKACQKCANGCSECKNLEICSTCEAGKQLTISGVCEMDCITKPAVDGEYCKDGVATVCGADITFQCKCGAAENCATCNEDNTKCETCLTGFKMDKNSVCRGCDDGYEKYANLCLKIQNDENDVKLSGGAIAGIVIGVLVVFGVAGGLAYYFIKKAKAGTIHQITAIQQ